MRFRGWYKYKAGEKYLNNKGDVVPGKIDECTVRAFLYEVPKGATGTELTDALLTGADDILLSEKAQKVIVGIADLKDCSDRKDFTFFDMKFEYKEGKEINYQLHDYRLAIVFASSKRGDFYEGAVGSTLIVDDVKIICEQF